MSTPTEPNSADRELANDLIMTVPTSIKLSVTLWNKAIDEWATHKIAAHRSSAVAEAVGPLQVEIARLEKICTDHYEAMSSATLQAARMGMIFTGDTRVSAVLGELFKRKEDAESDRESLRACVVRLKDVLARIRKDIPTDFNARGLRGRFVDETGSDCLAGFYELDHDELLDAIIEKIDTALREAGRGGE